MTYKDQEVVKWSSVLMHATKKIHYQEQRKLMCHKKVCERVFFLALEVILFHYYNYSYKYRITYQQTCKY